MGVINLTDHEGDIHQLEAQPGEKLMEVIREAGFPIEAICGGEGACATCHVHVQSDWYDKLPKPDPKELDSVEVAMTFEPGMSRLSCQILFSDDLNGLNLTLANDDI